MTIFSCCRKKKVVDTNKQTETEVDQTNHATLERMKSAKVLGDHQGIDIVMPPDAKITPGKETSTENSTNAICIGTPGQQSEKQPGVMIIVKAKPSTQESSDTDEELYDNSQPNTAGKPGEEQFDTTRAMVGMETDDLVLEEGEKSVSSHADDAEKQSNITAGNGIDPSVRLGQSVYAAYGDSLHHVETVGVVSDDILEPSGLAQDFFFNTEGV